MAKFASNACDQLLRTELRLGPLRSRRRNFSGSFGGFGFIPAMRSGGLPSGCSASLSVSVLSSVLSGCGLIGFGKCSDCRKAPVSLWSKNRRVGKGARFARRAHRLTPNAKMVGTLALCPPYRRHNLTNGPSTPITGSVSGNFTCGIVFSAIA